MKWFGNELPLCNPNLLQNKEFEAMAEIIEVQQGEELFGMDWHDPTCYATEILVSNKKKLKLMRQSTSLLT
jgi:hypothetical protein